MQGIASMLSPTITLPQQRQEILSSMIYTESFRLF
jgi:hypothetical protein